MLFFFFPEQNFIISFQITSWFGRKGRGERREGGCWFCLFVLGLFCFGFWFGLLILVVWFFLEKRWGCVSEKIRASQQFSQFLQHSLYCAILRLSLLGFFSVFTNNTNDTKVGLITGTLKDIAVYRIALLPLIDRWRV